MNSGEIVSSIGRVFFARVISPGWKWWQTLLRKGISCSQPMGRPKHALKVSVFLLSLGEGGVVGGSGFFFIFPWFPMCSHYVPNMFPLRSHGFSSGSHFVHQVPNVFPNMFSIAPHFYPLCFGNRCPLFTYVGGRKERNALLQNRNFYFLESLHCLFEWWANQIGLLQK